MRQMWLAILGISVCSHALAEPKWIQIRSTNFQIFSSASERATRDTIGYFEQVRNFFNQSFGEPLKRPAPLCIVAFGSEKEYQPYKFNEFASAYYHPGSDRDYIVMSHAGADTFPVAVHEYVHLVVDHADLHFPPWLNEGLAEVYSTIEPRGDKVLVGSLIANRQIALLREKWTPLAVILSAAPDSPYYNEKDKAGSLYNEGWALTHMLMLSSEYRPKFQDFLAAVNGGMNSPDALAKTYGRPVSEIEKDLRGYLLRSSFTAALLPVKLQKVQEDLQATPATDFDIRLLQADLLNRPKNEAEAAKLFEELSAREPKRPEPWIALARLAWRKGNNDLAVEHFGRAFDLGNRDPELLWDYARLAERKQADRSVTVLNDLLNLQPTRLEVRLELASMLLTTRHPGSALATLGSVAKVTPADAPRLFTLLAYAQLQTGDRAKAKTNVDNLEKFAATEAQKSEARRLRSYLQAPVPERAVVDVPVSEQSPKLIRSRRAGVEETAETPSVRGSFVELACHGEYADFILATPEGKKAFRVDDPEKIVVVGRAGGKVDLECGAQKPVAVKIEYGPAEGRDADGVAQVIYFER